MVSAMFMTGCSALDAYFWHQIERHDALTAGHERSDMDVLIRTFRRTRQLQDVLGSIDLGHVEALRAHGPPLDALHRGSGRESLRYLPAVEGDADVNSSASIDVYAAAVANCGRGQRRLQ